MPGMWTVRLNARSTHWPGASSEAAVRNIDRNSTRNRTSAASGPFTRAIDHLEDIAVDRLAKEEALERRGAQRVEQLGSAAEEPLLQRLEFRARIEDGHMAAEL